MALAGEGRNAKRLPRLGFEGCGRMGTFARDRYSARWDKLRVKQSCELTMGGWCATDFGNAPHRFLAMLAGDADGEQWPGDADDDRGVE
jgi:hypothetical protein